MDNRGGFLYGKIEQHIQFIIKRFLLLYNFPKNAQRGKIHRRQSSRYDSLRKYILWPGICAHNDERHALIKRSMREKGAVYAGEMSAHHYFRDFAFCDSGMIPWLVACEIISQSGALLI